MNNAVFVKTRGNLRNNRDIKIITTEAKMNYLVLEQKYYTTVFSDNLLAIEMKRTQILLSNSPYLCLWILEISKIVTYEFWYDYAKPKYREKAKLCYMNIDSFIVYIKTKDI